MVGSRVRKPDWCVGLLVAVIQAGVIPRCCSGPLPSFVVMVFVSGVFSHFGGGPFSFIGGAFEGLLLLMLLVGLVRKK
ncbi:hypothetical protein NRI_0021 [Neorickettsia risticii str. Illinois]|uniref:Transmembrane protein n=2 Tax=Neorickettsia risticii TaxID=950 RepID=C6V3Q3_NEORI|nr:hypothetical protein NRI_0021 [Neorickettsia risticii str. Illinois]